MGFPRATEQPKECNRARVDPLTKQRTTMISPSLQNTPRPIWRVGDRCQHADGPGMILVIQDTTDVNDLESPGVSWCHADGRSIVTVLLDGGREVWQHAWRLGPEEPEEPLMDYLLRIAQEEMNETMELQRVMGKPVDLGAALKDGMHKMQDAYAERLKEDALIARFKANTAKDFGA